MKRKEKQKRNLCLDSSWLEIGGYIDPYSYHDAPSTIMIVCTKLKNHQGRHSTFLDNHEILWA